MTTDKTPAPQPNVPAYRFLVEGDLIEATDEFIGNDGQTWARPDGWEVGMEYPSHVFKSARRLVSPAPAPKPRATDSFGNDLIERELVSIVLRMSRHLQSVDTPAAKKFDAGALDYLRRKGLMPSPLRAEDTVVQSTSPEPNVTGTISRRDLLQRMSLALDDLSPDENIGFTNGVNWVEVATVEEIRKAAKAAHIAVDAALSETPSPQTNLVAYLGPCLCGSDELDIRNDTIRCVVCGADGPYPIPGRPHAPQMNVTTLGLHADTAALIASFSVALASKLKKSQTKYGHTNGWKVDDWERKCKTELLQHVIKGDPLDVAAYAAFCWARGWTTRPPWFERDVDVAGGMEWEDFNDWWRSWSPATASEEIPTDDPAPLTEKPVLWRIETVGGSFVFVDYEPFPSGVSYYQQKVTPLYAAPLQTNVVVTDELATTYKAAFRAVFDRWLNDVGGIPQENIGLIATKAGLQAVFAALAAERRE